MRYNTVYICVLFLLFLDLNVFCNPIPMGKLGNSISTPTPGYQFTPLDLFYGNSSLNLYNGEEQVSDSYFSYSIVGDYRVTRLEQDSTFPSSEPYEVIVNDYEMVMIAPYSFREVYAVIKYDGSDNPNLIYTTGLGSLDFTSYDGFYFDIGRSYNTSYVSASIFTDYGTCSCVIELTYGYQLYYMPWEWFLDDTSTSCDFTSIGAIQLTYSLLYSNEIVITGFGLYKAYVSVTVTSAPYIYPSYAKSVTSIWTPSQSNSMFNTVLISQSSGFENTYSTSRTREPTTCYTPSPSRRSTFYTTPTVSPSSWKPSYASPSSNYTFFPSNPPTPCVSPSPSRYPTVNETPSYYPYSSTVSPSKRYSYIDIKNIDTFSNSSDTLTIVSQPYIQQYVMEYTNSSTILGGQRDTILLEESGATNTVFVAGTSLGVFFAEAPYGGMGSISLQYDGLDNTIQIDKYGLGGIDFTCGGECNSMRLQISGIFSSIQIIVYTFDSNTNQAESCEYTIPQLTTSLQNYFAQFSEFENSCDWSNVGALEINGEMESAGNIAINEITICKY